MARKKQSTGKQTSEEEAGQFHFLVEPGRNIEITLDVSEVVVDGSVPFTMYFERGARVSNSNIELAFPQPQAASAIPGWRWARFEALKSRLQKVDLATWLFGCVVTIYLLTRLIGLTQFPIYFFTDEAIQSLSMKELIQNEYRDPERVLFPTYFRNGDYYNLGLSVYLQWLPVALFGKSAVATRVTSVLVTLIAAISIGLMLRDIFRLKYWWAGTFFLSIIPAWFLHSRTAFETVEFVAFYAGMLCAYLYYRYQSPRYFYLTILLGAFAFYTYSPAQVLIPLTALGLLVSDWRYHSANRGILLHGLALTAVLALPYIRSAMDIPNIPFSHLHTLYSYWFEKIPLSEKIARYFSEYGVGLSPWYWYIPNNRDLVRHLMKDYGHIMITTLPLALLGMAHALQHLRSAAYRTTLIALLISPSAAALVQISVTRALLFVVPAAILTAVGLELVMKWIEDPKKRLIELEEGQGPSRLRVVAALIILILGIFTASMLKEGINAFVLSMLVIILALQISGIIKHLAHSLLRGDSHMQWKLWTLSHSVATISVFVVLAGANVRLLNDALRNGPLWFRDYGLGGMQYGAFQIFDIVDEYVKTHPETRIIFSPNWANGGDVLPRFFLNDFSSIQVDSVRAHLIQKLPLDQNTLFVMIPEEYDIARTSPRLTDLQVERVIPFPDGTPGFYFVRLRYADNVDEVFAAEKSDRQTLRETTLPVDGQAVRVRYSYLDSDFQDQSIALVFDNDPFTLAKTFEANPFVIEMTFPESRTLRGFSIIIGSAKLQITLKCYSKAGVQPIVYLFEGEGTRSQPELSFDLPAAASVQNLQVEVLDPRLSDQIKIHIWELKLR